MSPRNLSPRNVTLLMGKLQNFFSVCVCVCTHICLCVNWDYALFIQHYFASILLKIVVVLHFIR